MLINDTGGMIVSLLNMVDNISNSFVFDGYQNLVAAYSGDIYILITISVILYGYGLLVGWISHPLGEAMKRIFIIGIVISLAMKWGSFSSYVYDLFTKAPNQIAEVLIKSIPDSPFSNAQGINEALQQVWYDILTFTNAIWDRGGISSPLPYLWAIVLFLIGIILVGLALVELVVAKFGLAIFLVLAPIAIPTLLFKATQEIIFNGWLRHLIGFSVIPIFVVVALALGMMLMSQADSNVKAAIASDQVTLGVIAPYLICSTVCIGIVFKASAMAVNFAGSFSMGASQWASNHASNITNMIKEAFGGSSSRSDSNAPSTASNSLNNDPTLV